MIIIFFLIGMFLVFMTPMLVFMWRGDSSSLAISRGFATSMVLIWVLFLVQYAIKLSDVEYRVLVFSTGLLAIIYALVQNKARNREYFSNGRCFTYFSGMYMGVLVLLPLWEYVGEIFFHWDSIVSWNFWAQEIASGSWTPNETAYPVFYPALWSLVYKIQGTTDIWWTAKLTLLIAPFFLIAVLCSLFRETKDRTYMFIMILCLPYIWWEPSLSGYMDVPVMILGVMSLSLLFASDNTDDMKLSNKYLLLAFILAGVSSVVKQSGIAFVLFCTLYTWFFNSRRMTKIEVTRLSLISLSFYASFLVVFFQHNSNPFSNLSHLMTLTGGTSVGISEIDLWPLVMTKMKAVWNNLIFIDSGDRVVFPYQVAGLIVILGTIASTFFYIRTRTSLSRLGFASFLFFWLGTFVWLQFFSYDYRNGVWAFSFWIISCSIAASYLISNSTINNYFDFSFISKIGLSYRKFVRKHDGGKLVFRICLTFFSSLLFLLVFFFENLDDLAYKNQINQQERIDNVHVARSLNELLANSGECVKVFTNRLLLPYNYHMNSYKDKIATMAVFAKPLIDSIDYGCKEGTYIVFGPWTKARDTSGWEIVRSMEKSGTLRPVGDESLYIYFAPSENNYSEK